ncbi:MAG TPA: helix-turn-helix domain-containing protein [Ramlibacter sp.]|nr:helix-turn-helix domain-containing protein [Ramlibacter sp.]
MAIRKTTTRPRVQAAAAKAGPSKPAPSASDGLGARLRTAREHSGATVRGLARAVGVSPSLVSQIERGRVMPSVGTLYAITTELGLAVDDVFNDDGESVVRGASPLTANGAGRANGAVPEGPVQRHETRRVIRLASGVRWELLTAAPDDEVEFLYVVYDVGGESCAEDSLMQHGGKEYAYLLSGRLGVKVGFNDYELGPGDSISFDAQMPHRLFAIGEQPAVAVWVVHNRRGDRRTAPEKVPAKRGTRGKAR